METWSWWYSLKIVFLNTIYRTNSLSCYTAITCFPDYYTKQSMMENQKQYNKADTSTSTSTYHTNRLQNNISITPKLQATLDFPYFLDKGSSSESALTNSWARLLLTPRILRVGLATSQTASDVEEPSPSPTTSWAPATSKAPATSFSPDRW